MLLICSKSRSYFAQVGCKSFFVLFKYWWVCKLPSMCVYISWEVDSWPSGLSSLPTQHRERKWDASLLSLLLLFSNKKIFVSFNWAEKFSPHLQRCSSSLTYLKKQDDTCFHPGKARTHKAVFWFSGSQDMSFIIPRYFWVQSNLHILWSVLPLTHSNAR